MFGRLRRNKIFAGTLVGLYFSFSFKWFSSFPNCLMVDPLELRLISRDHLGWAGLGWAGLGWAGLGWAGLGWAGLGWAGLGWAGLGWAGLGWAGLGWAGLGWAGLGWAGLGWAGLGWAGLGWAGLGWAGLQVANYYSYRNLDAATNRKNISSFHRPIIISDSNKLIPFLLLFSS